ncbi:hypothetical protein GJ744_006537 [Endocarpon pusillum]|uniref:Uncharacterized protein n=1 Tax=Endocarpon pusillum TaxID=364733 RepID=A0A8H7ARA1_9EURO|nr:hypothetical protein GJ744_006537 [Endocarpon pusillum]
MTEDNIREPFAQGTFLFENISIVVMIMHQDQSALKLQTANIATGFKVVDSIFASSELAQGWLTIWAGTFLLIIEFTEFRAFLQFY